MNRSDGVLYLLAALLLAAVLILSTSGCSSATYTDEDGEVSNRFEGGAWRLKYMNVVVDNSTGVQYLIVEGSDGALAVCPLYNADGTLCTE